MAHWSPPQGATTRPITTRTTRSARPAETHVALEPQRLCAGARVADEERSARERREREGERGLVPVPREDEPDRAEHERLADPVGGRVDEGAERRRLAAGAGECAVEDVEDRAEQEQHGADPEVEQLVAVFEVDAHAAEDAERDAGDGERGRRQPCPRQPGHDSRGQPAAAVDVQLLDV